MSRIVSFRRMEDGTREDYLLLDESERRYAEGLGERLLESLRKLDHSLYGYPVTRLQHSLQTATRAAREGADEEMVVAALLHDVGDELAPYNHSEMAAAILRPYVRPEVAWIVEHHGLFQNYYYVHHLGGDRYARDRLRDHRRQREDGVGDHDDPARARDEVRVLAQMRHQHEEGDSTAGAEDHDGTEDVQIFDDKINRHDCVMAFWPCP